jgi:hypothetical protein
VLNKRKFFILLVLFFAIQNIAQGFIVNRGTFGDNIIWFNLNQSLILNTSNIFGFSDASVSSITSSSVTAWNAESPMSVSLQTTSGGSGPGQNDIYFSSNAFLFGGSNVLAVTQVSFIENTGEIIEADIMLNESASGGLSNSVAGTNYIGDIITHEVGHFLGLGHGQTHFSSMFFELTKGQRTLHADDIFGLRSIYANLAGTGSIVGTVAGSQAKIGVFGSNVQFISQKTGKVVGSVTTDSNGRFEASGFALDDTYFIYVEPLKNLEALPEFFSETRKDFCSSGNHYRGGFFQPCNSSERGHPTGVSLSSSVPGVDVGTVSIRCSLDVPIDYLPNKGSVIGLDILDDNGVAGDTIVGFMSESDIAQGTEDIFNVDLSTYNVPAPIAGGAVYLEVKTFSQALYSSTSIDLDINSLAFPASPATVQLDSDGNPSLNIIAQVPMTTGLSAANNYTITVKPKSFDAFQAGSGFSKSRFFPSSSNYADPLNFYVLSISVIEKDLFGTDRVISTRNYGTLSDNSECMDAVNTFAVKGNTPFRKPSSVVKKDNDAAALACGSVGTGGPPSGGPLTIALGFMLACLLGRARQYHF